MKIATIILILTATSTAIMAGLFFAYTFSVMPGLAKLSDTEFIKAMQSINREIQNPVFFAAFFGALILLPISTYMGYGQPNFWYIAAAMLCYVIGAMGVTMAGNVPLNNALENFNIVNATNDTIHAQRIGFEAKWNLLNSIRTASSFVAIVLVIAYCIKRQ